MVELTDAEIKRIDQHINQLFAWKSRHGSAITKFRPPGGGSIWDGYRRGFGAEVAVARWLGKEWNPQVYTNRAPAVAPPDIEPDIEVRSSRDPDNPMLHVGVHEPSARRYVGCHTPDGRTVTLLGWIWGFEAPYNGRLRQTQREDAPEQMHEAWAVAAKFLRPIDTLQAS